MPTEHTAERPTQRYAIDPTEWTTQFVAVIAAVLPALNSAFGAAVLPAHGYSVEPASKQTERCSEFAAVDSTVIVAIQPAKLAALDPTKRRAFKSAFVSSDYPAKHEAFDPTDVDSNQPAGEQPQRCAVFSAVVEALNSAIVSAKLRAVDAAERSAD